ncbi:UvrD-helicase domain-containing protein [Streptomyces californicus]|uniref:UvrD-helicase domain-containing protein n=1 Tax=Streptomyces californicus TaxID=67351 RepID=UPI0037B5C3FB
MSRKPPLGRGEDSSGEEDQLALFTGMAKKASRRSQQVPGPRTPAQELSRLISRIARSADLHPAEVNRRLNRKLGVTTRSGASDALIERAVQLAQEYLDYLSRPPAVPVQPTTRPSGPRQPSGAARRGPDPTGEQERAIEMKKRGVNFALQAGAGTGKTTTLEMVARAGRGRGTFLAFNRTVVDDAARRFPHHVRCSTPHSIAMKALAPLFGDRYNGPREPAWRAGERLGIDRTKRVKFGERVMTHKALSSAALGMVVKFTYSTDEEPLAKHLPYIRGLAPEWRPDVGRYVLPYARKAWEDLQDPSGRKVRFDPNHALKIWAMKRPVIPGDFLLLDEAQDTNPVLEEVFTAQKSHAQLIMVGDSAQAIYGWRGARDVMKGFEGEQLVLSQSFRFGPAIAQEANRWLEAVESPIRLRGNPATPSEITTVEHPDAVLCRTNAGTITETFRLLEERKKVALVGSAKPLEELAIAAGELKAGRRTAHPELVLFETWGELQEYAEEDPMGGDLQPLVDIVDTHGATRVLQAVRQLTSEDEADVAISTGHKAKGREWPSVRIAADFEPQSTSESEESGMPVLRPYTMDDYRLAYVAVTRARYRLDPDGLRWINDRPDLLAPPGDQVSAPPAGQTPAPSPATVAPSPWDVLGPPPPM